MHLSTSPPPQRSTIPLRQELPTASPPRLERAWDDDQVERGRPRGRQLSQKQARKLSISHGREYQTTSLETRAARAMRPNPCKKCPYQCTNWSEHARSTMFTHYWVMGNYQRQRDWITSHVTMTEVKRRRTKVEATPKRVTTYQYFLDMDGSRVPVCKQFFLATLDLGEKTIYHAVRSASHGTSKIDQRGRKTPVNKTSKEKEKFVQQHIESLPAVASHYCRKETRRLYLDEKLKNITNLHRLYTEKLKECMPQESPVTLAVYKRVFKEYNISFHHPKKDKCSLCESFRRTQNSLNNEEMRNKYEAHIREKEATYKEHQEDQLRPDMQDGLVCASFDLQKVLNTPCGESVLLYYSRKLAVYNMTVYESRTKNGYCKLWTECDARKGAVEVGTVLFRWLSTKCTTPKPPCRHIIMYCDCCGGQNRNKYIVAMLLYAVQRLEIDVLELKFLLSGHTYMQVDSMHAAIEYQTRNATIWAPSEWRTVASNARKEPAPYHVEWLKYTDMLDWKHVESQICLHKAKDDQGKPVKWSAVRQIKVQAVVGYRTMLIFLTFYFLGFLGLLYFSLFVI